MEFIENSEFEILTDDGFKDFDGIKITRSKTLTILFNDGTKLKCTNDHLVIKGSEFVTATSLSSGDILNSKIVSEIIYNDDVIDVYDAINVHDTHHYITNDVTSHNCAFIDNYDEFFASVFPTISSGSETKIIMTSTPRGLNHFYKTIKLAKQGQNGFHVIEVPWHRVPGRDDNWKQKTLQALNGDTEKFDQEFNIQFLGSSGTLISGWKLQELVEQPPIMKNADGLKQYKIPVKDHQYTLIADVARGKGLDYSAFSIIDITSMPYEQVCTFKSNNILVADYAEYVLQTAKLYNSAYVLVEINDIGEQAAWTIQHDFEYENLLMTEAGGSRGKKLTSGFGGSNKDLGIRTTAVVKSTGCSMLKMLIEQNQLIVNDAATISELTTFSKKNNSYEAESGTNDDLVMGLVLFGWMTGQPYFKELNNINTLIELREKTKEEIGDDIMPFGFINNGYEDSEIITADGERWIVIENDNL